MRDIAIVGAGPYGLSLAAHLGATRADFRIFGVPMQSWTERMPKGMHLKSEGFASTLYDGAGTYPFSRYCKDNGIPYADVGLPVSLEAFSDYGKAFQKRFVPMLEAKQATRIRRQPSGFELTFEDGEVAMFRRVVLAVGITRFAHVPESIAALSPAVMTHASAHHDMARFAGKTVAVVGGGSSATDCAAALVEAGATAHIVTRGSALKFHSPPRPRSLTDRIRWPLTTIGTGWRSFFCTRTPLLFHALPREIRHEAVRRHLGPTSCWFTRDAIEASVEVHTGSEVAAAAVHDGRAVLTLMRDGQQRNLVADHVMAATGYKVDIDRLRFLDASLRAGIRVANKTPVLSRSFESTVDGLYFVGVASANAFGPLVRFACGAEFTAGRLSRHLAPRRATATAAHETAPSSPSVATASSTTARDAV